MSCVWPLRLRHSAVGTIPGEVALLDKRCIRGPDRGAAAACRLAAIHRGIGMVQQGIAMIAVCWIDGKAYRSADVDLFVVDSITSIDVAADLLGNRIHEARIADLGHEHHKFISAITAGDVVRSDGS